jgi:hypothetical protein
LVDQGSTTGPAWPVPNGWRTETIPFPIEFAPTLPYRGFEEVRFHPDFFLPAERGWWTYAVAWACSMDEPAPRSEVLEADLTTYWDGLATAVAGAELARTHPCRVRLKPVTEARRAGHAVEQRTGEARVLDPFGSAGPVRLQLEIERWVCPDAGRTMVLALASPRNVRTAEWRSLREVGAALACHSPRIPSFTPEADRLGRPDQISAAGSQTPGQQS